MNIMMSKLDSTEETERSGSQGAELWNRDSDVMNIMSKLDSTEETEKWEWRAKLWYRDSDVMNIMMSKLNGTEKTEKWEWGGPSFGIGMDKGV